MFEWTCVCQTNPGQGNISFKYYVIVMFCWIFKLYAVFCLTAVGSVSAGNGTRVEFPMSDRSVARAVERAADYLWRTMQADHWSSLTPRVAVALTFAQRAGVRGQWLSVLDKEVAIHTEMALLKSNASLSAFELSQHVNALYATCQDPRHFHGLDLVRILRTQAAANRLEQPFVLLTLCLANQIDQHQRYFTKLRNMYYSVREDTLGSKALIVMALACLSNAQGYDLDRIDVFKDFKRSAVPLLSSYDVYTKILHVQALNAVLRGRKPEWSQWAVEAQWADGSFGDVLATYYAIPALLGASLLDLKCKTVHLVESPVSSAQDSSRTVVYSLWIEEEDARSIPLPLQRNATLFDLMKLAQAKNSFFSFQCDATRDGCKVYSIGAIPNDAETSKVWTLYRGRDDRVKFISKDHLAKQMQGVDRIYPAAGDHFVFWYERSST